MTGKSSEEFQFRPITTEDHKRIIDIMPDWWGGRDLRYMLPKMFFNHFRNTSFLVEKDGNLAGFLVGLISPAIEDEAYIHFAGIDPGYRKMGLGRLMYEHFFDFCRSADRRIIRCCTSPVNKESIEFHTRIGFTIEPGNGEIDGIAVTLDYNREGDTKVLFKKVLE